MSAKMMTCRIRGAGLYFCLAMLGITCAQSPQEELTELKGTLLTIERSDAVLYVAEEVQKVRRLIHNAESQLASNRFVAANRAIRDARVQLDSIFIYYDHRRKQAARRSDTYLRYAVQVVDSLSRAAMSLPRQTYVEQNTFGLAQNRVRALQAQLKRLLQYQEKNDYLSILREAPVLDQQIIMTRKLILRKAATQFAVKTISLE